MIRKTFKTLLIGSVVLGGAGFLFLGTDFPSYVSTVATSVREEVAEVGLESREWLGELEDLVAEKSSQDPD